VVRVSFHPSYCPKLYLDANVLIDAILEDEEKHDRNRDIEKIESIRSARQIYDNWPKDSLLTSPYAIGEFMGKSGKFRKSYHEMLEIARDRVFSKCVVLHSSVERRDDIAKLEEGLTIGWHVEHRSDQARWGEFITAEGGSGGFYAGPRREEFAPNKPKATFYSAPLFESLLFAKASEIESQIGIHFEDAITLTYVMDPDHTRRVDIIASNDQEMRKRWNDLMFSHTGIEAMSTLDIARDFCRWMQKKEIPSSSDHITIGLPSANSDICNRNRKGPL